MIIDKKAMRVLVPLLVSLLCCVDINLGSPLFFQSESSFDDACTFTLVESMPENLTYPSQDPLLISTYEAHKRLLESAKKKIHLSTFYWTLRGTDTEYHDYSSAKGEDIFNTLHDIVKSKKVDVKIVQNDTNDDTIALEKDGAQVRTVDFDRIMHAGVLHTKMWMVDDKHMYIGSNNFDWRSYTQIKELGVLVENCSALVTDAAKLFEVYWYLGALNATIPSKWPIDYQTDINKDNPILQEYNNTHGLVYLSSSPPEFCPPNRTSDIDAIVDVIRAAKKFIYISVMDYCPIMAYISPQKFWPVIDNELRRAAFDRNVDVYLMAAKWKYSSGEMFPLLKSLAEFGDVKKGSITVKLFTVPAYTKMQKLIDHSRVDHSKYMVTDVHAYIGTSNWSGDYFVNTAGVGFILQQSGQSPSKGDDLRKQLKSIFLRDWNSEYAKNIWYH